MTVNILRPAARRADRHATDRRRSVEDGYQSVTDCGHDISVDADFILSPKMHEDVRVLGRYGVQSLKLRKNKNIAVSDTSTTPQFPVSTNGMEWECVLMNSRALVGKGDISSIADEILAKTVYQLCGPAPDARSRYLCAMRTLLGWNTVTDDGKSLRVANDFSIDPYSIENWPLISTEAVPALVAKAVRSIAEDTRFMAEVDSAAARQFPDGYEIIRVCPWAVQVFVAGSALPATLVWGESKKQWADRLVRTSANRFSRSLNFSEKHGLSFRETCNPSGMYDIKILNEKEEVIADFSYPPEISYEEFEKMALEKIAAHSKGAIDRSVAAEASVPLSASARYEKVEQKAEVQMKRIEPMSIFVEDGVPASVRWNLERSALDGYGVRAVSLCKDGSWEFRLSDSKFTGKAERLDLMSGDIMRTVVEAVERDMESFVLKRKDLSNIDIFREHFKEMIESGSMVETERQFSVVNVPFSVDKRYIYDAPRDGLHKVISFLYHRAVSDVSFGQSVEAAAYRVFGDKVVKIARLDAHRIIVYGGTKIFVLPWGCSGSQMENIMRAKSTHRPLNSDVANDLSKRVAICGGKTTLRWSQFAKVDLNALHGRIHTVCVKLPHDTWEEGEWRIECERSDGESFLIAASCEDWVPVPLEQVFVGGQAVEQNEQESHAPKPSNAVDTTARSAVESSKEAKSTTMSTIANTLKDDAVETAYRTAARRLPKYARSIAVKAFASRGKTDAEIALRTTQMEDFLSGEMGEIIVAGVLSAILTLSPETVKARIPWIDLNRLARELRLKVEGHALDAVLDLAEIYAGAGIESLKQAFAGTKLDPSRTIEAPKRNEMDAIREGVLTKEAVPVAG